MNITFFIGNGFDINIGLQTRYQDFYPYFLEKSDTNNMIRTWLDQSDKLWSDLEENLGLEMGKVQEEKLECFYKDKEELDSLLIEYLEREQDKYSVEDSDTIMKEFSRSMLDFYSELPTEDISAIKKVMEIYKDSEFVYSYITFNYTNILDRIIDLYDEKTRVIATHTGSGNRRVNRIGNVMHIHGTTDEEMILGVNDKEQIDNIILKNNDIFLDTFIKRRMNSAIRQRKTEKALEIINSSHIICIFGMSIGNTDKMWWEILTEWLINNNNNILLIYWKGYEDALKKKLPARMVIIDNIIKRKLFDKGKGRYDETYYDSIKDRIIITYNSRIFSLPEVGTNCVRNIFDW